MHSKSGHGRYICVQRDMEAGKPGLPASVCTGMSAMGTVIPLPLTGTAGALKRRTLLGTAARPLPLEYQWVGTGRTA
jgi:hypothetical protein